jgi:hypothetical protein
MLAPMFVQNLEFDNNPAWCAYQFVNAVVDRGDVDESWKYIDPDLQLARVQMWLLRQGLATPQAPEDDLAAAIVSQEHELWPRFAVASLARWRTRTYVNAVRGPWGLLPVEEFPAVDLALIRFGTGEWFGPHGDDIAEFTVTTRYNGQVWPVAGLGPFLAVPGWPPWEQELPRAL